MTYDNTNRGVLFRNDKRETDNHPEYTGKIDVNGTEYRLAAWVKESSKDGKKFFSLAVSEFQKKAEPETAPETEDFDDDIPF